MDKKKLGIIYHKPVGKEFEKVVNECMNIFKQSEQGILEKFEYRIRKVDYDYRDDCSTFLNNYGFMIDVINWSDVVLIISPIYEDKYEINSTWAYAKDACIYTNKEYYIVYNQNDFKMCVEALIKGSNIVNKTDEEPKITIPSFELPRQEKVLILGDCPASEIDAEWYNYMLMNMDRLLVPLNYNVNSINIREMPQMSHINVTMGKHKHRYVYYIMSKIKEADAVILLKPYDTYTVQTDIWEYLIGSIKAFANKKIVSVEFGNKFDSDMAMNEFNGNLLKALNDKTGTYNHEEYLEWTIGGVFNE